MSIRYDGLQFGQMGSAFQNLAKPVYPPKDMVIVAITFLADNTPTALTTEILDKKVTSILVLTILRLQRLTT